MHNSRATKLKELETLVGSIFAPKFARVIAEVPQASMRTAMAQSESHDWLDTRKMADGTAARALFFILQLSVATPLGLRGNAQCEDRGTMR